MKKEMNKTFLTSTILGVVMICFGLLLVYNPDNTITSLSHTLAVIIALIGLVGLYRYWKREDQTKYFDFNLLYFIISVIVSIVLWIKDTAITGIIPLAVCVFMIVNTSLKFNFINYLRKHNNDLWRPSMMMLVSLYLFSILLLLNLTEGTKIIMMEIGIVLIIYSGVDINLSYLLKTIFDIESEEKQKKDKLKKKEKAKEEKVIEEEKEKEVSEEEK